VDNGRGNFSGICFVQEKFELKRQCAVWQRSIGDWIYSKVVQCFTRWWGVDGSVKVVLIAVKTRAHRRTAKSVLPWGVALDGLMYVLHFVIISTWLRHRSRCFFIGL